MTNEKLFGICREYLNYNPNTGLFTWIKTSPYHRRHLGEEAGKINNKGYRIIGLLGNQYQAHQLAFLISHNHKAKIIDHINGDKADNRLCNLRSCSSVENSINRKVSSKSKSGYKGVIWCKRDKKWRVQIKFNGKIIHLGFFTCKHEAARVWNTAARMYQGYEFCYTNVIKEDISC